MGPAGCTNPDAANYNPSATSDDGTCTFVVPESDKELSGDLYTYVTSSLSSLWGESLNLNQSGLHSRLLAGV